MADVLHGTATYPGLKGFVSCEYTVSHGITPSLITFTLAPPNERDLLDIQQIGDVVISDANKTLTLKDCIAFDLKKTRVGDGFGWSFGLYDHRWRWQFGRIDGRYNERDNTGRIRKETKLSVWEMAGKCIEAMGEENADLGDLPDPEDEDQLPQVNWDCENPAKALAELCDQFNCRIVWQPIKHRILIAFPGNGAELPNKDYTEYIPAMTKPIKPSSIEFVGAPLAFVVPLLLDPVGEDLDGSIVPIDELSYKPSGGWSRADVPYFDNLYLDPKYAAKEKTIKDCTQAALKSVFRYFRATTRPLDDRPFTIEGLAEMVPDLEVTEDWQIVPLDSILGADRDERKNLYSDPPKVYGEFYEEASTPENSQPNAPVTSGFQIDSARGLVIFEKYMYKINFTSGSEISGFLKRVIPPASIGPADLVLLTSVNIRDPETKQLVRFRQSLELETTTKTKPRIIRRDDIQYSHTADYKVGTWDLLNPRDNFDEVSKAADEIMTHADDYDRLLPEEYSYPRIEKIDPDGAITQVTWSVSGSCSTRASRNGEHARYVPPYKVRRGQERSKALLDRNAAVLDLTLKLVGGLTT